MFLIIEVKNMTEKHTKSNSKDVIYKFGENNIQPVYSVYYDPSDLVKVECIICGEPMLADSYVDPEDYDYTRENSCHECGGVFPRIKEKNKLI